MKKRRGPSSLNQIHERSVQLAKWLLIARRQGKITPGRPRTGATIAKQINDATAAAGEAWNLSGSAGIRELVNHAREIGLPISGDGTGYFWADNSAELNPAIADMKSRIAKMNAALQGEIKAQKLYAQMELDLFKVASAQPLTVEEFLRWLRQPYKPDKP